MKISDIKVTKMNWVYIGTAAVILALLLVFGFCSPAHSAETGGTPFLAISARYMEQLGIGMGAGYQFKGSGVLLLGQVTYDQLDTVTGTTTYTSQWGRTHQVPFTVPATGHRGFEVTVAIPLRKATH